MLKKLQSVNLDNHKIKWIAFFFVFFIFLFESYTLEVSYSEYYIYLFDTQDVFFTLIIAACIAISLFLFYFFTFLAFSSEGRFKALYFLVFSLAAFVEYGYQKALGRFSDTFDIESAVATTSEQKIASLFLYFNLAAVIPCLLFLICLVVVKRKETHGLKSFLLTFLLCGLYFAGLSVVDGLFIERKFPTVSLSAFCRTNTDFLVRGPISNGKWNSTISGKTLTRRAVGKPPLPENYHPENNIVLVIDESVRGDHLSLNGYHRQTTPFLDKLPAQGILHNWGIAVSASTGSRFSYNALVTGLTPDDFPDKTEFKVNTFPTIFQYAKAMNYKTYFFDGQMKNYWGGITDDKNYIDSWAGVENFNDHGFSPTYEIDNRIAREVKQIISNSSGNFIFIFKHGSHIPYQDSFPSDRQIWQPSYSTENKYDIPSAEYLPEIINAYDNAIRYNFNSFFENLVSDYSSIPNNTIIVYSSDHGQTLFANGKSSHGGKTKEEANIPLFIIGKLKTQTDTKYKASHQNLFPTLLDLMSYPENFRERKSAPSLLKAKTSDSKQRFFNPDLDSKIPFD